MIDIGWKAICPPGRTTWGEDIFESTLEMTAQTFNAAAYPVPVIAGHIYDEEMEQRTMLSQGSVPAYGQVLGLKYENSMLFAHVVLTEQAAQEVKDGLWLGCSVDIEPLSLAAYPPPNPAEQRQVPVLCHLALLGSNTQGISGVDSPNTWFTDLPPAALAAEAINRKITKLYYTTPLAGWKLEEGIRMKEKVMLSPDDIGGGGSADDTGGGGSPAGDTGGGEASELQKAMLGAVPDILKLMLDALTAGDIAAAQTQFDELCTALEELGLNCKPDIAESAAPADAEVPTLDTAQTATLEAAKATAKGLQLENSKLRGENDKLKLEGILGGLTEYFNPAAQVLFRNQLKRGVKLETVLDNINTTKVAMGSPRYPTKPLPITNASPVVKKLRKVEDYESADSFALEADFTSRGGTILEGVPFDPERHRKTMLKHPELIGGGK